MSDSYQPIYNEVRRRFSYDNIGQSVADVASHLLDGEHKELSVKRYDLEWEGSPYMQSQYMNERPDGDWVRYEDVQAERCTNCHGNSVLGDDCCEACGGSGTREGQGLRAAMQKLDEGHRAIRLEYAKSQDAMQAELTQLRAERLLLAKAVLDDHYGDEEARELAQRIAEGGGA